MLADPARVARLADDMNAFELGTPGPFKGSRWYFSRKDWAVKHALERTPHAHRFLRPLAGVPPVPVPVLVAAVRAELARDEKASKLAIDDALIELLLQRFHYIVEPWPFAALG